MRLRIAACGRWKSGPERDLYSHFAGRITLPLEFREIEEKKKLKGAALIKRQGALLLAQIPKGAIAVALDEKGKALTSSAFAEKLALWRDDGIKDVVFLIGGADGMDSAVLKRADLILSFGAQTWPHLLVRGMLAEQIYRAGSILAGHPYHRQ